MKKIMAFVVALFMVMAMAGFNVANAAEGDTECQPRDAYTETVEHPAETHTEQVMTDPGSEAVAPVPAVDEVWANFAPNKKKATFVGPAKWPTDERGTWIIHNKIPGGHVGPDGVYAKGNPAKGGNWFYRQAGKPAVPGKDAVPPTFEDRVIVDKEAWTEEINHPAVTCDDTPPTEEPCPDDSLILNEATDECEPLIPGEPAEPQEPQKPATPAKPVLPKNDPVVKTDTTTTVDKTVKVHTLKSGKVVREVINYDNFETYNEEGF